MKNIATERVNPIKISSPDISYILNFGHEISTGQSSNLIRI